MEAREIVLGWVLGVLSPLVADAIRDLRNGSKLKEAVGIELRELQHSIALASLRLFRRAGELTQERVQLVREIVTTYAGPEDDPQGLEVTKAFLALSWEQQVSIQSRQVESSSNSPRLVKYTLPFVEAHLPELRKLPFHFQWRVSQILRDVQLYNGLVDYCDRQLERTFDASLTSQNHAIVVANIEASYRSAAIRAERIVREIRAVTTKYSL